MKNRLIKLMMIGCALFCCTACFDIQENLFVKKDGSGTFSFIVEMPEMKSMMAMFASMGDMFNDKKDKEERGSSKSSKEKNKKSSTSEFSETFEKTRRKLLNTADISNVKMIEDTASFSFGISFDFKNIDALNVAMNKLFEDDTASNSVPVTFFEYKDGQFKRLEALDSKSILGKSSALSGGTEQENAFGFDVEKLFSTVSYTTNYEFEQKVTSAQNENAMLAANMQKVTLKVYPFVANKDTTKAKPTIANTISFR